jgi:hypothetical protein
MVYTHFFLYILSTHKWQLCIYISSFIVQADVSISITEYARDVDCLENIANDDCDCIMTPLLPAEPSQRLVICPDKLGNISRFSSGIDNHTL